MGRKIVVFADGTGNAYTRRESNIWRLYQALDSSRSDQIAYYIEGVGTSGVGLFALIDGATGIGVPANVRKVYRFLCWNWNKDKRDDEPDDEIYMFGFSRGAFTIRTLIGLIEKEGLVPATIDGTPVSHAEMQRNTMAAWRSYRHKTVPRSLSESAPTIWISRAIRDLVLRVKDFGLTKYDRLPWTASDRRRQRYRDVSKETERQNRLMATEAKPKGVRIKFVGLFDTVEAYGVPIEELRSAVDWAIWPISFRNHELGQGVEIVRHALSLDDERTTFHPLRFDMRRETKDQIKEVWFAGAHSDVGGGYPNGALSYVPLAWIAEEARAAGLRWVAGALDGFRARASAFGPYHDSREGLAALYRYDPRPIAEDAANGGVPVIHYSVAEKMVFGSENYAPVTLPRSARVLLPDGSTEDIRAFCDDTVSRAESPFPRMRDKKASSAFAAVAALREPDEELLDLTRDTVFWRRITYFALLFAVIVAVCLPFTAEWIGARLHVAGQFLADLFNVGDRWQILWDAVASSNSGVGMVMQVSAEFVETFLPSYAKIWAHTVAEQPFASLAVITSIIWLYYQNLSLRDHIRERARRAWFRSERDRAETGMSSARRGAEWPLRLAGLLRRSPVAKWLYRKTTGIVLPGFALGVLFLAVIVAVSRATVDYRDGRGHYCGEASKLVAARGATPFTADRICWASGRKLDKGHHYTVRIEITEPFFDPATLPENGGVVHHALRDLGGLAMRRWWSADWLQPIARVGARGDAEWVLEEVDGSAPNGLAGLGKTESKSTGVGPCEKPSPSDAALLKEAWLGQSARKVYVSQFVAPAEGEFFLYLNDALAAVPFGPTIDCSYANNTGMAKVTIRELLAPELEATNMAPGG